MPKKIKHNKDLFLETGTRKSFHGHQAWFRIDNQTFYSKDFETKKQAKWYADMMDIAFNNLRKFIIRGTGVHLREDLNPEFLKTIDGIEEALKRDKTK